MPPAKAVALPKSSPGNLSPAQARLRHREGLAAERSGDEQGAFQAFRDAAEAGHGPAQLKLGEIYDRGSSAVARDYATALGWYQKARDQGVPVPRPHTFPAGR
jgi:TPR repeat protein